MSEAAPESATEAEPTDDLPPPAPDAAARTLENVRLQPGAKARVAGLALALCGGLSTLAALVGLLYLQREQPALALGVFLGHSAAQLVTASWLVGAILTFDRSSQDFLQATLGMSPLRLVVIATVVGCGLWLSDPDPAALFFSLMLTHVAGHAVEGFVLRRLRLERVAERAEAPA